MKLRILWIIAVLLACVTWFIHFRYQSDFSDTENRVWWFVNIWAMLMVMGICIFPLVFSVALFLPKRLSYSDRFNKVLPIVFIFVQIIFIYGLGSLAYGLSHGYHLK